MIDNAIFGIDSFGVLIILLPVVSAFIGWLTNFFAIKMLFHPRERVKVFFFTLQGIIPANQKRIAQRLSITISKSLLSESELKKKVMDNEKLDQAILDQIDDYVGDFLKTKLVEMIPMASMFLGDDLINKAKGLLINDIREKIPDLKESMVEQALANINIKEMVQEKIENLSLIELEKVLMDILKKEFRFVEITGAIVGFLIGCLQIMVLYL